ncbi:hypothetical protein FACS1894201_02440 [Bacteroidia bacterium]|nr:hypothetical protein FACS1894201_02440 [Bacteroidia bacterium]
MVEQIKIEIMKKYLALLFLIFSVTSVICQNNDKSQANSQNSSADSIVVSFIDALFIYPLTSDKSIEKLKESGAYCSFIYPLLILNNVIIREEKHINCFRNRVEFVNIKSTKRITKERAEKTSIPNVPKDGVLFVTTKKGYYFDFSCE